MLFKLRIQIKQKKVELSICCTLHLYTSIEKQFNFLDRKMRFAINCTNIPLNNDKIKDI